jgi:transposase-like protein
MKRDAAKETFWRGALAELGGSGQSVREFCRQRGLKEGLLYAWGRRLRRRDAESSSEAGFVELVGPGAGGRPPESGVSVRVDDRVSIVLGRGFDGPTLVTAVACLLTPTGPQRDVLHRAVSGTARKAESTAA